MRVLPNMTVVVPCDDQETAQATQAIADSPGPVYMRLGRYPVPRVTPEGYRFEIGKPIRLREGNDVVLFTNGHMVSIVLEAADLLAGHGIHARVVNVSTVKPLDEEAVLAECETVRRAFTVEEHNIIGGLGSAVAEVLAAAARIPLLRIGVRDVFGESGLADELLEKHGLLPSGICERVLRTQ